MGKSSTAILNHLNVSIIISRNQRMTGLFALIEEAINIILDEVKVQWPHCNVVGMMGIGLG